MTEKNDSGPAIRPRKCFWSRKIFLNPPHHKLTKDLLSSDAMMAGKTSFNRATDDVIERRRILKANRECERSKKEEWERRESELEEREREPSGVFKSVNLVASKSDQVLTHGGSFGAASTEERTEDTDNSSIGSHHGDEGSMARRMLEKFDPRLILRQMRSQDAKISDQDAKISDLEQRQAELNAQVKRMQVDKESDNKTIRELELSVKSLMEEKKALKEEYESVKDENRETKETQLKIKALLDKPSLKPREASLPDSNITEYIQDVNSSHEA